MSVPLRLNGSCMARHASSAESGLKPATSRREHAAGNVGQRSTGGSSRSAASLDASGLVSANYPLTLTDATDLADPDLHVLVEDPPWGDAEFLGKWLLAAAQAAAFWKEAYQEPAFNKQVQRLCIGYIPDFGISASIMVMQLKEYRTTFVLDLDGEEGEHLVMMLGMGFFLPIGQTYNGGPKRSRSALDEQCPPMPGASVTLPAHHSCPFASSVRR
jgi:hypothetical protein